MGPKMAHRRRFDRRARLLLPPFFLSTALGLALIGAAAAAAAGSTASISAPIVAPPPAMPPAPAPAPEGGGGGNPVTALLGFVRDQMVRMKDGTVQLYTNHQRCNDIRSRQRLYAEKMGEPKRTATTGGITYSEFDFLVRGRDDRGKLGSLLFMMFFAPNFLPYAIMFNPGMMPSPFHIPAKAGFVEETRWEKISRERTHSVVKTLLDVERAARVAPTMSKMNPFGGAKTRKAMEQMGRLGVWGGTILSVDGASGPDGASVVMNALEDEIYTPEVPDKSRTQLAIVPKAITKGLARVIEAESPPNNLMPNFLLRGQIVNHVTKVATADEFLVRHKVDLSDMDEDLLLEACSARCIGGPGRTGDELRAGLSSWLDRVVTQPEEKTGVHYNANLARAALMCYNAVDGARDARAASYLPRLLFQGQYGGQLVRRMEGTTKRGNKSRKK